MFLFHFFKNFTEHLANLVYIVKNVSLAVVVYTGNTCRTSKWMTAVCKAAGKKMIVKVICDFLRYRNAAERIIPLAERDDAPAPYFSLVLVPGRQRVR